LIVCGMLKDKDHVGTCTPLARQFKGTPWVVVSTSGERAMSAYDLLTDLADAPAFGLTDVTPVANMQALKTLILSATKPGDVILAFGSFSVVELCQSLSSDPIFSREISAGANTIE
jgi:folylpolyglutamate synthase/dihydropteroate synthase